MAINLNHSRDQQEMIMFLHKKQKGKIMIKVFYLPCSSLLRNLEHHNYVDNYFTFQNKWSNHHASSAEQFCSNIVDYGADIDLAFQMKKA